MPLSRAIIPSPELEEERGKELAARGGAPLAVHLENELEHCCGLESLELLDPVVSGQLEMNWPGQDNWGRQGWLDAVFALSIQGWMSQTRLIDGTENNTLCVCWADKEGWTSPG